MQENHCPICYTELQTRETAPCDDCGGDPVELEHLREGKHTYAEYEVFPGLSLTLCDFCAVDFGSYDPAFFGLTKGTKIGFEKMNFVRQCDNPQPQLNKFCPRCGYKLPFLRFVAKARERHTRE
jgi:rRNA maturation endonuclease Nob1